MSVIYKPTGAAGEYGEYALNLYRGCNHGCNYCYAPGVLRMTREAFAKPEPRLDVLLRLEKDLKKGDYAGKEVFLCFTTDPYNEADEKYQLTRQAIQMLHAYEVKVKILTKAGERSKRDFDLLAGERPDLSYYGASLTTSNSLYEPYAAPLQERITTLNIAYLLGIPTWASLEPVIDPVCTLAAIDVTHPFVDFYAVGKWNHDPRAKLIDWKKFHDEVVAKLEGYGKKYYIKNDLKEAAE